MFKFIHKSNIHLTSYLILILFSFFNFIQSSIAREIPELNGRINDYAQMLSTETKADLEMRLEELEKSDTTQLVFLSIPSLEGDSLEEFSIRVADKWKIGQKKIDNGVILLVAKNDRKVRIEVGKGLEGKLTDLIAGRIIRENIVPYFKRGNYQDGVVEGIKSIVQVVNGEYISKNSTSATVATDGDLNWKEIIATIITILIFGYCVITSLWYFLNIILAIISVSTLPAIAFFILGITNMFLLIFLALLGLIPAFFLIARFLKSWKWDRNASIFNSSPSSSSNSNSWDDFFSGSSGGGGGGFSGGGGSFGGGGSSGSW
ncbi:MAG: TPM domain-containing protein [Oligoflexia bacterium]|nr:TPM domain-containing protein [Oligoflexia bacterium]